MIDTEKMAAIETSVRGGEGARDPLKELSEADLRKLKRQIDALIPGATLKSMNLEDELVEQYGKTKDLMDEVLADDVCPANQKAQVANAVVTALGQLVRLQEDLRRQETFKIMESVLIDAVKTLPEEARMQFEKDYTRLAEKANLL